MEGRSPTYRRQCTYAVLHSASSQASRRRGGSFGHRGAGQLTRQRPRLISRLYYAAARLRDLARPSHTTPEPDTASQRLGHTEVERPIGRLVWVHSQKAAEAGAIVALTQELARLRGEPVYGLLTSGNPTPPPDAVREATIHQLVPGETAGSVTRFLDHWSPDAGVILGSPDRPNLIVDAAARGIHLFLAGSERGQLAKEGRLGHLAVSLLENFQTILLPSAGEAQAFHNKNFPPDKLLVTGPLADTALALPCNDDEHDLLRLKLSGRPVWLAAFATMPEIEKLEKAQRHTIRAAHRLLCVLVPRSTEEAPRIVEFLEAKGWRTALRSSDPSPDETVQVYIVDTHSEMGLWYRLAPITYLGGTLDVDSRAADPYEPAALGSAIIHGPHTSAASERFERLKSAGASIAVGDTDELCETLFKLQSPERAAALAHAGWSVTSESANAVEKLAELIDAAIDTSEVL